MESIAENLEKFAGGFKEDEGAGKFFVSLIAHLYRTEAEKIKIIREMYKK
jgi:hypothetical protein